MTRRFLAAVLCSFALLPLVRGSEFASGQLNIAGVSLEVLPPEATGADIPGIVETKFGGHQGDAAPATDMVAAGDLNGPGLDAPITVKTQPGHAFTLPPLHEQGNYTLSNIRLLDRNGAFVQAAAPSSVVIQVVGTLDTTVTVKQLTPDDLRARGITIDPTNFDSYDYNFVFTINGQTVQVPYTVIVDKRTHQVIQPPAPSPYQLPTPNIGGGTPPRFQPPTVIGVPLTEDLDFTEAGPNSQMPPDSDITRSRPSIPAAIVLPNGFGVLHQFFAIILNVTNAAPAGTTIRLNDVTASFTAPNGMRIAKVTPAVAIGQPVPIYDAATGATFLVAAGQGSAEWSLEALRTGTQTVDIDIHATYQQEKQIDVPLKGHVSASVAVSDPRFQINFIHPDTIRAGESYTAYAFVTNISSAAQTVSVNLSQITACDQYVNGICRVDGDATFNGTIAPGATQPIAYHLKSNATGRVSAAALDVPNGIDGSVTLAMGVNADGIPLSPATIVLPYYAQFVDAAFVQSQMPLIGITYSLATAPTVPSLASFPRLITTDVFTRAQNIARAGQRIFVARSDASAANVAEDRDPIFHLALDLLGNLERIDRLAVTPDLHEWDQAREKIADGRVAEAGMARELERVGLANGRLMSDFVGDFAAATSHRAPFFLALVHGAPVSGNARPYALTVSGATSTGVLNVPAETNSGATTLPFGQLTRFNSTSEAGELAIVGRWQESLSLSITAASANFTIDLIYPDTANGAFIRSSIAISGATAGTPMTLTVDRGNRAIAVSGATATSSASAVAETPLSVVHAAQDLHLDPAGHIVTLLFNRPVQIGDASRLHDLITLQTSVPSANVTITKKNDPTDPAKTMLIPGAAIQDDGRLLNISFDHALSTNAQYRIGLDPFTDAVVAGMTCASNPPSIAPRIDNNAPGGVVVGTVIRGDNTVVKKTLVQLTGSGGGQFDVTGDDGTFLFEFVHRDIDLGFQGTYSLAAADGDKRASLDGAIRTAGEVQRVVLQFLGRGSANGHARYSDGTPIANAPVTIGSTIYGEFHRTTTDATGLYTMADLPVGPLTFAVVDAKGNVSYAANQIATPGQVVTQDLVIEKKDGISGLATVRVTVRRSDLLTDPDPSKSLVAGAHVGVYTQGYGLVDGYTNTNGQFTFNNVPAGFVSVLASQFGIAPQSAGVDFDLKPDTLVDQQLVLHVPTPDDSIATITGIVQRDDPTNPNLSTLYPVPGARVTIGHLVPVIAGNDGKYVVTGVPTSLAAQRIVQAFDPATGRSAVTSLPQQLQPNSTNDLPITMRTTVVQGTATLRVVLNAASGEAVPDYHVIWPGYPYVEFDNKGGGVYELQVKVPQTVDVRAVPLLPEGSHPKYGDQVAHASMRADFDGQIVQVNLRLPGQGTVSARVLKMDDCPAGRTCVPPTFSPTIGNVRIRYLKWSATEQGMVAQDRTPVQTDATTKIASFPMVPVGGAFVETIDNPFGYSSGNVNVQYEGHQPSIDLTLETGATVAGRVLNWDGRTPIAGAEVRMYGSIASYGPFYTAADGTYLIPGVSASQSFRVVATVDQNGIYRTGFVDGSVPKSGGPVTNVNVLMRQQANIDGSIVDASSAPIPLARYWVRELAWPYRTFGSQQNPLTADRNGHFFVNNLFSGDVRITAEDPVVQENRADLGTTIAFEGDNKSGLTLQLGTTGTSTITVTVLDANNNYVPVPNAEVTLVSGDHAFDFASSDQNGVAIFGQVPVGTWRIHVTSRVVGRSGGTDAFTIAKDVPYQVTVPLTITGTVSGTVFDDDVTPAVPVLNAPVTLSMPGFYTIASTQAGGAFLFNGVPEGTFALDAVDVDSGRHTRSAGPWTISKLFPTVDSVQLFLTRTATLTVNVYLPDDAGNASSAFVPAANIAVSSASYSRALQAAGGPVTFQKLPANSGYAVEVTELGGQGRYVRRTGSFPPNTFTGSMDIVLPAFGTVQAQLSGDATQIAGASVNFSGGGRSITVYTDAGGFAKVTGMPLGSVSVQAVSQIGLSASASVTLASQSEPVTVPLTLGNFVSVDGFVDAEAGGASVGTKVDIDVFGGSLVTTLHLEARTDANGYFRFTGIPNGATLNATWFAIDGSSVGARVAGFAVGSGGTLPHVRLDSTPPLVTAIDPANNANSVSPTSHVHITFSETINPAFLTNQYIQVIATDDGTQAPIGIPTALVNGVLDISPLQLLKSNVVYRVFVSSAVQDLAGNRMTGDVTSSFTTVNYTEPKIIYVLPDPSQPVFDGQVFQAKFNKAIDVNSFQPGNGGTATLQQLDAQHGNAIGDVPLSIQLDLHDNAMVDLAPTGVKIIPGAFYRLTIAAVRDTQQPPNVQKAPQSFDFFAYDTVKPVVTIVSPVPAGQALVSGGAYSPTVAIVDDGTTTASKDIAYVDWFSTDGTTKTAIARIYAAPWALPNFVAPVTTTGTKVTLYASATDLSKNTSDLASDTWDVSPNLPPQNVTVTLSKTAIYLHNHVGVTVAFTDEGTACTATLQVVGRHADGTDYPLPSSAIAPANALVARAPGAAWPAAIFAVDLPSDLKEGDAIHFIATVTDSDGQKTTQSFDTTITPDGNAPVIVSMLPKPDTSYPYNSGATTYPISVNVQDAESGVARVTFAYDGTGPVHGASAYDAASGTWTFSTTAAVTPKNTDTRIHIIATAYDYHGNSSPSAVDVVYQKVDDATIPVAQWITPLDGAALPANQPVTIKLRLHAVDDVKVESVAFNCPLCTAAPAVLTAPTSAGDLFEETVTINTPAEGMPFAITASVSDSNPAHTVVLPITIDAVAVDTTKGDAIISGDASIDNTNFNDHNLVVTGSSTHLYARVPLTLKNLIVLNGATVGNPDGVKLDLTIANHLYVDGDSSINVTAKGLLGGWHWNEAHTSQNNSSAGITVANGTGAISGASASYAGIGGSGVPAGTNAVYGSIAAPSDFGSGGGGAAGCCTAGGNGGGAVSLRATTTTGDLGRFVIAGAIRADGENGGVQWGSGSGGSILVSSHALVTGHATRITANGGDDPGANNGSGGGGGGRIAVTATDRLDTEAAIPLLQARGGRNAGSAEGVTYGDGGAGTIFLRRPSDTNGTLTISAFDDRYPSSQHLTHATPLANVATFDSVTAASRALVRIDDASRAPATVAADGTSLVLGPADVPAITLSTNPAGGASLIQGTAVAAIYNAAASRAGIERIDFNFTAGSGAPVLPGFPPSSSPANGVPINVGTTATPGSATLTAIVTDRAGRTASSAAVPFTIVANQPPSIAQFDLTAPAPLYIGGNIAVVIGATDDVAVKTLSLTTQIGNGAPSTQSASPNAPAASQTFNVTIPRDVTLENATVTLTAKADDGLAAPVTSVKTLTIAHDAVAPAVTVTQPNASTPPYTVDGGVAIHVVATVVDNESGVNTVSASISGSPGVTMQRTANANEWAGDLAVPSVPGSSTVTRTVTVTATDFANNQQSGTASVQITPHYDATAPIVTFTCAAEGAIVAPGSSISIGVTAVPGSSGTAVTGVSFTDGTTTIPATLTNGVYTAMYVVPSSAANGSTLTILASATTNGQGTGTQQTQLAVIAFDKTITASTTIFNGDTTYDNRNVLVTGGTVTIVGPHAFKKLVILGGTVIPQDVDILHPDTITVDALYVACNATIDASSVVNGVVLGFPKTATYPGAGTPGDSAGGGHMGRGGPWSFPIGGTFGSVYHPMEPGGGGEEGDPNYFGYSAGGGVVRIIGTTVTVDGIVRANAMDNPTWGGGAGGSVYITATNRVAGNGQMQAVGGAWASFDDRGGGGGGAIAVEYGTAGGTLLQSLIAIGGNAANSGGAGTVYTRGSQSTFGDLTIANSFRPAPNPNTPYVVTDLPAFGTAAVLTVPSAGTATIDAMWEGPYLVGNSVRVFAPDGSVRGTWPITAITNPTTARTLNGVYVIHTSGAAYSGYLMYSDTGYNVNGTPVHILPVQNANGAWQYDTATAWVTFTPQSGDVLFASFGKSTASILSAQAFTCPRAVCPPILGMPTAALVRGKIMSNTTAGRGGGGFITDYGTLSNQTIFVHPDDDLMLGVVLSTGPATVTLGGGADVRAGDTLRGIYRFDNVTVKNAIAQSVDLIESTTTPSVDAASKLTGGNLAAPKLDTTKIRIVPGNNGPVVSGTTGAVNDPDGLSELYVTNGSRTQPPSPPFTSATSVNVETKNGITTVQKLNSGAWADAATDPVVTGYAYLQARVKQTTAQMAIAIGEFDLGPLADGTFGIWVDPSWQKYPMRYTAGTLFRLEKTPTTIRFYQDGALIFEMPCDTAPRNLLIGSIQDWGAVTDVDYGVDTIARFSSVAAADGSFTVPLYGAAGDALTISARDRHPFPMTSTPIFIGTIPASATIAAPALSPNPATGGHTVTGTVTLGSAAPAGGATVLLSASSLVATVPASVTIPQGATSATFAITTAVVTSPANVTITATYGATSYASTLALVLDNVAPAVSVTSPQANSQFVAGYDTINVQATVTDADSGVGSVVAVIDSTSHVMTANGSTYSVSFTAPFVDGTSPVAKQLVVDAQDRAGNVAPVTIPIIINPVLDPTPPAIAWSCMSTAGVMFPVAYSAKLDVTVVAPASTNVVRTVVFNVDDGTSLTASPIGNNVYEATWLTPAAAKSVTITAVATAAGGGTASVRSAVSVVAADVAFTSTSAIAATSNQWESKVVAISGSSTVVTIDGQHNFAKLLVLDGAKVVETSGVTSPMILGTSASPVDLYVGCGASIDVSGRGYPGGQSYPGVSASTVVAGGSHIGLGTPNGGSVGATFGSVEQPQESGGGGGNYWDGASLGGGVVTIVGGSIVDDGAIRANGIHVSANSAGGSILISAATFGGTGSVESKGAYGADGSSGGGAISVSYSTLASGSTVLSNVFATGGADIGAGAGGAGSIFTKGPGATFGNLTIDSKGVSGGASQLPALGNGLALNNSTSGVLLTDSANDIPAYAVGRWVEIRDANAAVKGLWRIASIDATNRKRMTLAPNGSETITIAQGDQWRGVYRFDNLTINGVSVSTADRVDSTNPPLITNGGVIIGNNQGAPVVDRTKITVPNAALSPIVNGTAGAVSDTDQPITVYAKNGNSGVVYSATAAGDGSFSIAIQGNGGDPISFYAKDANVFPMQSAPVPIGTVQAGATPLSTLITSQMSANDANFRARRLAIDGTTLAVATVPSGSIDSNRIAIFDISGVVPVWQQTITAPSNVRDLALRNGVLYVTGTTLYAYDLSVNPATLAAATNPCTLDGLAIDSGYAFAGNTCGDGGIEVFDVSSPKVPARVAGQRTFATSGLTYTQILPYASYLIALGPNAPNGHYDVVLLDRRDPYNLALVGQLDIPSFSGIRASLQGTMLYIAGTEGALAVVDVGNPASPVTKSVMPAGSAAHGVQAVGQTAFIAADTSGTVEYDTTNPLSPQRNGAVVTGQAAWDIAIRGTVAFVAAEDRVVTFAVGVPPQISAAKIRTSFDGQTLTVTGSANAIAGAAPLTAELDDNTAHSARSGISVAADGSFTATLAASAGDAIALFATDTTGRRSITVSLGSVPFAASTQTLLTSQIVAADASFRARRLAIDGTTLAVATYPATGGGSTSVDSNKIAVFDISGAAPAWQQTITAPANIRDLALRNGVLYATGTTLYAYDLSVSPPALVTATNSCTLYGVAIVGSYAFGGNDCGDGGIEVFDISNPKAPSRIAGQRTIATTGLTYTQIIPYGKYLVAIGTGGVHDVVVLDAGNPAGIVTVADVDVPGFSGFRGSISGSTLYVADASGQLAILDLTNPSSPATLSVTMTGGAARAVTGSGARAIVANGFPGATFFDVTSGTAPRLIGSQPLGGNPWDAILYGGRLFVANEDAIVQMNLTTTQATSLRSESGGAAGGGGVMIDGANLDRVTAVKFGGAAATKIYQTAAELTVAAPAHAAGVVDVVLSSATETVTMPSSFTYVANDDLNRDFSIAVNPSPRWSYGWEATRGAAFNLFTINGGRDSNGLDGWNNALPNLVRSSVMHPVSIATLTIPAMKFEIHPGTSSENSVVRWTCPASGTYKVAGYFIGYDYQYPTTTDCAILRNNSAAAPLFAVNVMSYNQPQSFSVSVTLNAGDTIEFTVGAGPDGTYYGDATGIEASISLVGAASPATQPAPSPLN